MCYKLEGDEAYFLINGEWVHEMYLDVVLGMKEGENNGY